MSSSSIPLKPFVELHVVHAWLPLPCFNNAHPAEIVVTEVHEVIRRNVDPGFAIAVLYRVTPKIPLLAVTIVVIDG